MVFYKIDAKRTQIKRRDTRQQTSEGSEGVEGASAKPPRRSRRSETPHQHAERAGECHQANRAKGSRDEVPCGVQRQRLWSLAQERNPASARASSMKVSPTESRERVKGRSPLWRPEAKPLVAPAGAKPRINTRKQYENVTNSIAKRESRGSKTLWQVQGSALLGLGAKPLVSPLA